MTLVGGVAQGGPAMEHHSGHLLRGEAAWSLSIPRWTFHILAAFGAKGRTTDRVTPCGRRPPPFYRWAGRRL